MKCDSVMNVWITVVAEVTALLVVETETTVNALNEVLLARLLNHALLAKREYVLCFTYRLFLERCLIERCRCDFVLGRATIAERRRSPK
jgi:hypothetical protein